VTITDVCNYLPSEDVQNLPASGSYKDPHAEESKWAFSGAS